MCLGIKMNNTSEEYKQKMVHGHNILADRVVSDK